MFYVHHMTRLLDPVPWLALALALTPRMADAQSLSRGDSALIGRILVAEDRRDAAESTDPDGKAPALRVTPSHEIALARSLHRLGRLDEARRRLDAVVRARRDDGLAWLLLAQVASDQRDWRAARQAADQAVRLRGDQAEPHLLNAYVCVQQNDFDAAVQSARLAIQRDARDATGYCLLGQSYEGRGETGPARDAYFDALVRDPQSALARALLNRLADAKSNGGAPLAPAQARRTAMILGDESPTSEAETP